MRVEVDIHGLFTIDDDVVDASLLTVLRIEFQILHHVAEQNTGLEHLNFVFYTRRVAQKTEIFYIGQHFLAAALLVVTLDEHTGRNLIHGLCVAQVNQCAAHKDDE